MSEHVHLIRPSLYSLQRLPTEEGPAPSAQRLPAAPLPPTVTPPCTRSLSTPGGHCRTCAGAPAPFGCPFWPFLPIIACVSLRPPPLHRTYPRTTTGQLGEWWLLALCGPCTERHPSATAPAMEVPSSQDGISRTGPLHCSTRHLGGPMQGGSSVALDYGPLGGYGKSGPSSSTCALGSYSVPDTVPGASTVVTDGQRHALIPRTGALNIIAPRNAPADGCKGPRGEGGM